MCLRAWYPPALDGEVYRHIGILLQVLCCGNSSYLLHYYWFNLSAFWIRMYIWTEEQEKIMKHFLNIFKNNECWMLMYGSKCYLLWFLKMYFYFILNISYVCDCVLVCAHDCRYPQGPEGSDALEQEFQVVVGYPTFVWEAECGLSVRVKCAIRCWVISPEGIFFPFEFWNDIHSEMTKPPQASICFTISNCHLLPLCS